MFLLASSNHLLHKTLLYDYAESTIATYEPSMMGLIIRRNYHSDPDFSFGFYRYLKPQQLKRVCFKYLKHLSDLIAFLYLHSTQTEGKNIAFLLIESLDDFIDGTPTVYVGPIGEKTSTQLIVLFNLLAKLQKRLSNHPGSEFGRVGLTLTFKQGSSSFATNSLPKLVSSFGGSFYLLTESETGEYRLTKNGTVYASRYTTDLFQSLSRYRQSLTE